MCSRNTSSSVEFRCRGERLGGDGGVGLHGCALEQAQPSLRARSTVPCPHPSSCAISRMLMPRACSSRAFSFRARRASGDARRRRRRRPALSRWTSGSSVPSLCLVSDGTPGAGLWDSPVRDGTPASMAPAAAAFVLSPLGVAADDTRAPGLESESRRSAASTSSGGGRRKPLPSPRSTFIANTPPARAFTRQRSGAAGAGHGVST